MKRCRRCGWDLPRSEFSPEARRKDGLRSWCKACNAEYVRTSTDPEKRSAADRARRAQRNERLRRRRATDPEYAAAERAICTRRHQLRRFGITIDRLMVEERGECYLCGGAIIGDGEPDHIVPVASGGTSVRENIGLSHRSCNRRKQHYAVADLDWLIPSALDRAALAMSATTGLLLIADG